MKIEIKHRFTGAVIFEHNIENNSVALTVKAAIEANADFRNADLSNTNLRNADLSNTNLRNADLSDADFRNADFRNADLSNADFRNANLSDADFRNADLSNADFRNANLSDADLSDADLSNAVGNKKELRSMQIDTYSIVFTDSILQIGCRRYGIEEWANFTDSEISKMDNGALDWWKKWKDFIFKAIELSF